MVQNDGEEFIFMNTKSYQVENNKPNKRNIIYENDVPILILLYKNCDINNL